MGPLTKPEPETGPANPPTAPPPEPTPRIRPPALIPTGWIKSAIILLGVTVLAFAVAGLRGKRPQEVRILPRKG